MDRREMLGVVGAGAVGLVAMGGTARGGHKGPHAEHIRTLNECETTCGRAAHHCLDQLRKGGPNAEAHALAHELAMDCQATCSLATDLTARCSRVGHHVHRACAEVCRECAEACDRAGGDEVMEECARICREAEKICRQMSQGATASR